MRASRTWKIEKKNSRSEHAKVIMIVACNTCVISSVINATDLSTLRLALSFSNCFQNVLKILSVMKIVESSLHRKNQVFVNACELRRTR